MDLYDFVRPKLNNLQFGFRRHRSAVSQMLVYLDKVFKALDRGEQVEVLYTVFEKAFDKIDHAKNLKKLWNLGVRGKLWQLLKSYLSGRKQAIRVGECISAIIAVTSGLPQDSLLGPLLFLILINDIPEVCENNEILLCADDAKMLKSSSQPLFQLDVGSLVEWCSDNSMVLNATKCCVLSIGRHGSPDITMILGASGQWAVKQKDLGIIVDENLSWDAHISEKMSKALKTFYLIRRNCCVRSPQAKTGMYKSMILPVLAFESQAWHPNLSMIRKLNAFQIPVIRWILGHECSNDFGLTTSNLLPIPLYLQLCDLLMLSKIVQGNYEVLDELILVIGHSATGQHTRQSGSRRFIVPDARLKGTERNYFHRAPAAANRLPEHVDFFNPVGLKSRLLKYLWWYYHSVYQEADPRTWRI